MLFAITKYFDPVYRQGSRILKEGGQVRVYVPLPRGKNPGHRISVYFKKHRIKVACGRAVLVPRVIAGFLPGTTIME